MLFSPDPIQGDALILLYRNRGICSAIVTGMFKKITTTYCGRGYLHFHTLLARISLIVIILFSFSMISCIPKRNMFRSKKSPPERLQDNHSSRYEKDEHLNYSWDADEDNFYDDGYLDAGYSHHSDPTPRGRDSNLSHDIAKRAQTPHHDERRSYPKFTVKKNKPLLKDIRINARRQGSKKARYIYYRVKRGDTLYRISSKFNTEVENILRINSIKNMNRIKAGRKLKIPLAGKSGIDSNRNSLVKRSPAFRWPVKEVIKIRRDGQNGVKSIGIIITVRAGARILSSASGTVMKIGRMRGFGNYVVVKHRNRYITVYSNLSSINVHEGEKVRGGRSIGIMKHSDSKLHFQINYAGKPKNPLMLLPKTSSL